MTMTEKSRKKQTGYDKYVNWKVFCFPVALLFVMLFMPTPHGMKDVGMEYKVGPTAAVNCGNTTVSSSPPGGRLLKMGWFWTHGEIQVIFTGL